MIDLKAFRLINKLSQKEIAKYFECSQAFISQIELGDRPIPLEMISKLKADHLNNWILPENKFKLVEEPSPELVPKKSEAEDMVISILKDRCRDLDKFVDFLREENNRLRAEVDSLKTLNQNHDCERKKAGGL